MPAAVTAMCAILMAAAEVLAAQRAELRGTVKLLFQPAEEGLPNGESRRRPADAGRRRLR